MNPKTLTAFAELEKSLQEATRLHHRLVRLSKCKPPVYWELDPAILRTTKQLLCSLQIEKEQLRAAQKAMLPYFNKKSLY